MSAELEASVRPPGRQMMQTEAQHLDEMLVQIHERRKALQDAEVAAKRENILSLDWLRGRQVQFRENPFAAYGRHEYQILVHVDRPTYEWIRPVLSVSGITLRGAGKSYQDQIVLYHEEFGLSIRSCNAQLFRDFVVEAHLTFDQDNYTVERAQVLQQVVTLMKRGK